MLSVVATLLVIVAAVTAIAFGVREPSARRRFHASYDHRPFPPSRRPWRWYVRDHDHDALLVSSGRARNGLTAYLAANRKAVYFERTCRRLDRDRRVEPVCACSATMRLRGELHGHDGVSQYYRCAECGAETSVHRPAS